MASSSLDTLPMEMIDKIACNLEKRTDLLALSSTCRFLYRVIFSPKAACLRVMFNRIWDLPPGKSHAAVIRVYRARNRIDLGRVVFGDGLDHRMPLKECQLSIETTQLCTMRDLIVESYAGLAKPTMKMVQSASGTTRKMLCRPVSRNLRHLKQLVAQSSLVDYNKHRLQVSVPSTYPLRLLQAVWLLTLPWHIQEWSSRIRLSSPAQDFLHSQRAVYERLDRTRFFLDRDLCKVNLEHAVQIVDFFKYHLAMRGGTKMHEEFQALGTHEKPRVWREQIVQGAQKLGGHWKGCYAYLPRREVLYLRDGKTPHPIALDILDEDSGLATLRFNFAKCLQWPKDYENALGSFPTNSLIEKLRQYPMDWIQSQDDPSEFSNSVSDHALEQRARSGNEEAKGLLAWKIHSRTQQYTREVYTAAKIDFLKSSHAKNFATSQCGTKGRSKTTGDIRLWLETPSPPLSQAKRGIDYHPFLGSGRDGPRVFNCAGNLHAIPPIEDIPGWQRITMIKRCNDHTEWCYEGLVFPGNMIMIGRWWNKDYDADMTELGPFIYWNVDK